MTFKNLTISIWITSYNVRVDAISNRPYPVVARIYIHISRIKFYTSANWRGWSSFSGRLITDEKRDVHVASRTAVCIVTPGPTKYYRVHRWCHPPYARCWKVSINDILDKFRCFRFNCCSARCSMRYYPVQRGGGRACPSTIGFFSG